MLATVEAKKIDIWIRALNKYDQVKREEAKIKAKLKEESEKAQQAQESLAKTSQELEETNTLSDKLKQELEAAEYQKKKLTQEIESTKKKIERARDLVDLLKNENKRWNEHLNRLQERYRNFLGDIVHSSGIITYLCVFPGSYRDICIKDWFELL